MTQTAVRSHIRDLSLAAEGRRKIDWVKRNMPILSRLEEEFALSKPFAGVRISLSVHLEAKTAYLSKVLAAGGAHMSVTGSNPLSTQDDVAAGLAADGIDVHAWYGATASEYETHIEQTLAHGPNIIIDDGGDLIHALHVKLPHLVPQVWGGCEETTTGILRLRAMEREGVLRFPMMAVNDAMCKHLFDNRYGTGQSVFDAIDRTTNLIIAGKTVVVAGYGWCGKGVAMRAKGLGAKVVVTEIDPVKAIEAVMDGFTVLSMRDAAPLGDLFVTVTGCERVIHGEHFERMKDGAILCNAGHFNVEICIPELETLAVGTEESRHNIRGYQMPDGRRIYLLGEGRLVNLACGDGHPAEIMDMSFAVQALGALYMAENHDKLKPGVLAIPADIDARIAAMKLESLNVTIDRLSDAQKAYLGSWCV